MKSDIIHVTSDGVGIKEALEQAEAVASYKSLSGKNALHLRLLTEEMMGMLQALTGEKEAEFWIEEQDGEYRLHLNTSTDMNLDMREKLLSVTTTGENAASKGVMGKIRDLFDRLTEPIDDSFESYYSSGWIFSSFEQSDIAMSSTIWSFNKYRSSLQENNAPKEDWDELEKSIVANLADEIEIGIRSGKIEMVIYKSFKE